MHDNRILFTLEKKKNIQTKYSTRINIKSLEFHKKEYSWFQIVDRDRVKHRKILRNSTDQVSEKEKDQRLKVRFFSGKTNLHQQFHHRRQAMCHHV